MADPDDLKKGDDSSVGEEIRQPDIETADCDEPVITTEETSADDPDIVSDDAVSTELKLASRSTVRGICRKIYRNVSIFEDFNEHKYRDVLQNYDAYMHTYDSLASMWKEHYANVQQSVDLALGLSPDESGKDGVELTIDEREKIRQVGCIALFGCGFNPTRELSPKVIKALADGLAELILVDFSRNSLRSSINFFLAIGIKPKAAYQMDLTMGAAAHMNTYAINLWKEMDEAHEAGHLKVYIDLITNEVDAIIDAYERGESIPGFFENFPIEEDDRPGLAVSSMVTAATFLTIHDYLLKAVKKSKGIDVADKNPLISDLRETHAKFNAFILRLNAAKMVELSKDNANILIVTDVNKVNLIQGSNPGQDNPHPVEETLESVKSAIDASVRRNEPLRQDLLRYTDNEARMSRDGNNEEPLEDIIGSVAAIRDLTFEALGSEKTRQWMWWDDPGNGYDDYGHGHKVRAIKYKYDKGRKRTIIGLLQNLPDEVIANGDPVTAARIVKKELDERIAKEQTHRGFANQSSLQWLEELEIPRADIPQGMMEMHCPHMCGGAAEIIDNVPGKIIEQGWEQVFEYLQKEYNWQQDNVTRGHVITGMEWLRRFIEALRDLDS